MHLLEWIDSLQASGSKAARAAGLVCNQTAWLGAERGYLFEAVHRAGALRRVFLPEHGLFAELQDQIGLEDTGPYQLLAPGVDFVSLYGHSETSLYPDASLLRDLDALLIDLQDVGARYYTFATTVSYLFEVLARESLDLPVYVVDRPNPAGRLVEGTILDESYQSFVGRPGLPHRHGLSLGELALFFHADLNARFPLHLLDPPPDSGSAWEIPPSPNMPSPVTPLVYSGQCLLEGTNLNEGRGTTRPFEIFGAPWLEFLFEEAAPRERGAELRPLRFIPGFHKHARELCAGFQIHVRPADGPYHSLAHTLKILRWIKERAPQFAWRDGEYEFRSDRPAIELLAGDATLLDYLNGAARFAVVRERLAQQEEAWTRRAAEFVRGEGKLFRAELRAELDYA